MAQKEFKYTFTVTCVNQGEKHDMAKVEQMIDLSMQDLIYDDSFVSALDEQEAVTIQVVPNFGTDNG
jgi:archaellin